MSDTPVILANGLGRRFGKGETELTILEEIDLTVMAGETVAIIGQSGSGKSTLLQLLGGLDTPTAGSVAIHGRGIATLSETARGELRNRELGFVYQFHHLIKELNALENVMLPALIGGKPVKEAREVASQLLVDAGLGERLRHLPGQLSGGERQRVAIARALVNQPSCLLADEPTGNLDEASAGLVFEMFMRLNQKYQTAMILVTHSRELASEAQTQLRLTNKRLTTA